MAVGRTASIVPHM